MFKKLQNCKMKSFAKNHSSTFFQIIKKISKKKKDQSVKNMLAIFCTICILTRTKSIKFSKAKTRSYSMKLSSCATLHYKAKNTTLFKSITLATSLSSLLIKRLGSQYCKRSQHNSIILGYLRSMKSMSRSMSKNHCLTLINKRLMRTELQKRLSNWSSRRKRLSCDNLKKSRRSLRLL